MSRVFIALFIIATVLSCKPRTVSNLTEMTVIPKPATVNATGDWFVLQPKTVICYQETEEIRNISLYLGERLKPATGFDLQLVPSQEAQEFSIFLSLTGNDSAGEEGYDLDITPGLVNLSATTPAGQIGRAHV